MKETIKFLNVLDIQRKRNSSMFHSSSLKKSPQGKHTTQILKTQSKYRSLFPMPKKQSSHIQHHNKTFDHENSKKHSHSHHKHSINHNKFPFFKALNFNDSKFEEYPDWLTKREEFNTFMYRNYESKLLMIPKICEKEPNKRASDQKYFVSLYLQQLEIFQNIPQLIMENILADIKTKKYQHGDVVHDEAHEVQFMAVVFVGAVEYTKGKKVYRKQRNQIIMSQAFYKNNHPTIIAKQETVLLCIHKSLYKEMQSQLKEDIYDKNRAEISDMMKSDFFIELHIKEKRAKQFYEALTPEFYFKNQLICEAGQEADRFFFQFKGEILEQNHIYIREHNKWPIPYKRWEVRAVYNSYQNQNCLPQFSFFGDEEIIGNYKFKSSYYTKSFCILFSMPAEQFKKSLTVEDFKRLKKYRNEHVSVNYTDFEQKVRSRLRSEMEQKKIIHKAINASFSNKTVQSMSVRKKSLLEGFQSAMLEKSKVVDSENEQNKTLFT